MSITFTIQVNQNTKDGKDLLEIINLYRKRPGIIMISDKQENVDNKSLQILSKKIKQKGTKKMFDKLGLDYDSYNR